MKIDTTKLDLLLARKCKSLSDLREDSSPQTLKRVRRGEDVQPKTIGRIARALGVDPADIIKEEA
ncbi:MAG: helix-turn-helix transcriptional regulator [Pseudoflavonifractor sp.]|nr:helix-turn-helix transcriptional regulator [Pseudoflavonifractor sp.]